MRGEEKMKNIANKIVSVMNSIESVTKDGFNSFHKYKYVTDAAIVTEIRKAMIEQKLITIPSQIECTVNGNLTTLKVRYTLIDADSGETLVSDVFGYGQDNGDKGVYKAATGAEKYFLLKTFLLPTDDDAEKDVKTDDVSDEGYNTGVRVPGDYWKLKDAGDIEGAQERIGEGFYPKKTPKGYFIFSKTKIEDKSLKSLVNAPEPLLTNEERLELVRVIKEKNIGQKAFLVFLEASYGIKGTAQIKKKDYPAIYTWVIKNEKDGVNG